MLSVEQAEKEMELAVKLTPGSWAEHSYSSGINARLIAEHCGMDADKAYVLGLLHDIGRRNGTWTIEHIFDGYDYMMSKGEEKIAQICMTHSFPAQHLAPSYIEDAPVSEARKQFVREYMPRIVYDDFDLLVQLVDSISLPRGACIMEKRLVDVVLRHGIRESSVERWKKFIEIKKYFDERCGCNIYSFLPNVIENSLENL